MITFPANLKEIGQGAFHGTDLKKVTFEEGSHIEVIGISVSAGPICSIFSDCASAVYCIRNLAINDLPCVGIL